MEQTEKEETFGCQAEPLPAAMEKGFREVHGDDGTFVCNVIEAQGRLHSVFLNNMADRLESYRQHFPVFDDDIYLLTYMKSGKWLCIKHWLY